MALTRGTDGAPVEKYAYSPFGEQRIFVDLTKPRIEQLRREGDRLLLEVSERIQLAALLMAQASGDLTLTHTGTGQSIEVEVTLPVLAGRTGAKRIAIRPTAAVEEGAPLRLHLAPGAVLDRFQNPLEEAYDRDLTWSALGAEVLEDTAPPQLDLVVVHENVLTVGFTEAIAAAQPETAITVDGNPVTWTSDEGGYTLHTEPLSNGVHRIDIGATLADLADTPLGEGFTRTVELTPTGALLYARPDPREVSSSAASNPYGFQGLPKDPETGFVYARNRYYDSDMGRFVSADPLGYVDGGNLYHYGLNDPVNNADPLGLANMLSAPASSPVQLPRQTPEDEERRVKAAHVAAPYIQGALQVGQGIVECGAAAGAASTGAGLVVTAPLAVHCADQLVAGTITLATGERRETLTHQGAQKVFEAAGASPQTAGQLATGTEIVASGGLTAGALRYGAGLGPAAIENLQSEALALHADQVIMNNYQRYYSEAWSQAVKRFNAGETTIPAGQSWRTVLGQQTDAAARARLRNFLAGEGIPEGPGQDVLVNRWLRDPSGSGRYRIPDVRLQQTRKILDGTIGEKSMSTPQIRDFIDFSEGFEVIIVKPASSARP